MNPIKKHKAALEEENPSILTICVEKKPRSIVATKAIINIKIYERIFASSGDCIKEKIYCDGISL